MRLCFILIKPVGILFSVLLIPFFSFGSEDTPVDVSVLADHALSATLEDLRAIAEVVETNVELSTWAGKPIVQTAVGVSLSKDANFEVKAEFSKWGRSMNSLLTLRATESCEVGTWVPFENKVLRDTEISLNCRMNQKALRKVGYRVERLLFGSR